mgnify:CR=1 FL=1
MIWANAVSDTDLLTPICRAKYKYYSGTHPSFIFSASDAMNQSAGDGPMDVDDERSDCPLGRVGTNFSPQPHALVQGVVSESASMAAAGASEAVSATSARPAARPVGNLSRGDIVAVFTDDPRYDFWLAQLDQTVRDHYMRDASIKIVFFEFEDDPLSYKLQQPGRVPFSSIKGVVDLTRVTYDAAERTLQLTDTYYAELSRVVAECAIDPAQDVVAGHNADADDDAVCPVCRQRDSLDRFLLCDGDGCSAEVHIGCMQPPWRPDIAEDDSSFFCDPSSSWTVCRLSRARRRRPNSRYVDSASDSDDS